MSVITGRETSLYYLTTGTRATWSATVTNGIHTGAAPASNFTKVTSVSDISMTFERTEADTSTRASRFMQYRGTMIDLGIEVTMPFNESDAFFVACRQAMLTDSVIALAFLSGDANVTGVAGVWADFEVFGLPLEAPLDETAEVTITFKPSGKSAVPPEYVQVS